MNKEQQTALQREIDFLKELHQASQMGRNTLEHINDNICAGELREAVEKDIFDYSDVCAQVARKLQAREEKVKPVGIVPQMMAEIMIDMKITDDTPDSEIAKMIIDGTTKGVTDCTSKLSRYADIDDELLNIGYKLLWVMQKNIDEMRRFLHN